LRRDPKVEVINAWRDVGRELVRICQVRHSAANPNPDPNPNPNPDPDPNPNPKP
jgi:hypothetical protein